MFVLELYPKLSITVFNLRPGYLSVGVVLISSNKMLELKFTPFYWEWSRKYGYYHLGPIYIEYLIRGRRY
jgi:hypothetical protein